MRTAVAFVLVAALSFSAAGCKKKKCALVIVCFGVGTRAKVTTCFDPSKGSKQCDFFSASEALGCIPCAECEKQKDGIGVEGCRRRVRKPGSS